MYSTIDYSNYELVECLQCGDMFVTHDDAKLWCSKCQGRVNQFEELTSDELQLIDFAEDDNYEC